VSSETRGHQESGATTTGGSEATETDEGERARSRNCSEVVEGERVTIAIGIASDTGGFVAREDEPLIDHAGDAGEIELGVIAGEDDSAIDENREHAVGVRTDTEVEGLTNGPVSTGVDELEGSLSAVDLTDGDVTVELKVHTGVEERTRTSTTTRTDLVGAVAAGEADVSRNDAEHTGEEGGVHFDTTEACGIGGVTARTTGNRVDIRDERVAGEGTIPATLGDEQAGGEAFKVFIEDAGATGGTDTKGGVLRSSQAQRVGGNFDAVRRSNRTSRSHENHCSSK